MTAVEPSPKKESLRILEELKATKLSAEEQARIAKAFRETEQLLAAHIESLANPKAIGPAGREVLRRIDGVRKRKPPVRSPAERIIYAFDAVYADAKRIAFGPLGLKPDEFRSLTPRDLEDLAEGWLDQEDYENHKRAKIAKMTRRSRGTLDFANIERRNKMLRLLGKEPDASDKDLAHAAGISRAWLYKSKALRPFLDKIKATRERDKKLRAERQLGKLKSGECVEDDE